MTWENCCYWTGNQQDWDDINPRLFDWWCPNCEMAVKDSHSENGRCPNCGDDMTEMENEIDVCEELNSGNVNGMTQDEEGNWGYD
jgi:reverse gyrase